MGIVVNNVGNNRKVIAEFFGKSIVLNDVKSFVYKNIIDSECWGESIISIADA